MSGQPKVAGWSAWLTVLWGTAAFHFAYFDRHLAALGLVYAFALVRLAFVSHPKLAFRLGFAMGCVVFATQLHWFWTIFGLAAVCLWAVLACFHGLFVALLWRGREQFGMAWLWLAAPVLWLGLEYFRSELYYLRFAWITVGYAFWDRPGILPVGAFGVYGTGYAIFMIAGYLASRASGGWPGLAVATLALGIAGNLPRPRMIETSAATPTVRVAGVQLEFPPDLAVPEQLDRVLTCHPDADILVLSEYTFDGPIPERVLDWCRKNRKYLVAGGKAALPNGQFYNTAYVAGPDGTVVFEQAKSVPIQFFRDGRPADNQQVWNSPWGRIGLAVCYDLSYRRVVDGLVRRGAQALIVPFMDAAEWGAHQHALHGRVGPVRAMEYGLPVFRLGSSGISQVIDADGVVEAHAGFPGDGEILAGELRLARTTGRIPWDAWLGPLCSGTTALYLFWTLVRSGWPAIRGWHGFGAPAAAAI